MWYLTDVQIDTFIQKAWHTKDEEDALDNCSPAPPLSPCTDKAFRALARQEDRHSNASIFV